MVGQLVRLRACSAAHVADMVPRLVKTNLELACYEGMTPEERTAVTNTVEEQFATFLRIAREGAN